jgi:hypothetical protein
MIALATNSVAQGTTQIYERQLHEVFAGEPSFEEAMAVKKTKPRRHAPWFVEKFKIAAGTFLAVNNTDVEVAGTNGRIGTDIDFENDLGFATTSNTFLAEFQWRSSSRSRFDLSYYGIHRSSNATLQRTVEFGDHTYNVNASVNAFFNTDIYRFSYGYAILSKPTFEAGLLIGAHVVKAGMGLSINSTSVSAAVQDNFGVTAPLPDFGVWGGYAFGQNWAFNGEFDYLSLTVDNIYGRILAYNFAVTYRPIKQLHFSAGYTGLNCEVKANEEHLDGHVKWGYNGPTLTAAFTFGRKGWD